MNNISKVGIGILSVILPLTYIRIKPESKPHMVSVPPVAQVDKGKYSERFSMAFANLIKEEGGYVNDPQDRGGETKYGISKRSYPNVDIKNLTLDQAAAIYKTDFYDAMRCADYTHDTLACEVLEQSVNMGQKTVITFLQIVAKSYGSTIEIDGKMGPSTVKAINAIPEKVVLTAIKSVAIAHYLNIAHENPPMRKFLKGWIRRTQT